FRQLHLAENRLEEVSKAFVSADNLKAIERMLVEEPADALGLASVALFREEQGTFRRRTSVGWEHGTSTTLPKHLPLIAEMRAAAGNVEITHLTWNAERVPQGTAEPVLAVAIGSRARLV